MTRFIACVGRKGGVGKSTLAILLGAQYVAEGLSVLMVDLDPQGSASDLFGLDVMDSGAARVFLDGSPLEDEIQESAGLRFLTGGSQTPSIPEGVDLRAALTGSADVVLIDCPPGHDALDVAAIRAADAVLIGTEAHRSGVSGAMRVLTEVQASDDPPQHAVVLGRMDARRGLDRVLVETLSGILAPTRLFTVRQDAALALDLNARRLPRPSGRAWEDTEVIRRWIR